MHDLRSAWRSLRSTPVVTAAAVLSLALGIGANTAIFSLLDRILLRSLPVAHPERLAIVSTAATWRYRPPLALATFEAIRANAPFADRIIAVGTCCGRSSMRLAGEMVPVDRLFVSGDFFDTLGIRAAVGRLLTPDDDRLTAEPPVGVISARFWKSRLANDPAVIGRAIYLDRVPVTIVGIVPEEFFGIEVGRRFDVALPIEREPQILPATPFDRNVPWLNIVVRLRSGVSIADAATALRAVQPRIRDLARPPQSQPGFMAEPLSLEPAATGVSALRERFSGTLAVLLGVVVMVLAIACANVSNIQLAAAAARRREVGVLTALGASRWRIVRARLVESAMLAAAGSLGGLFFARWAAALLTHQLSTAATPVFVDVAIDARMLAFAAGVAMLTTVAAGLWPAFRAASAASPIDALKSGGAGGIAGRGAALSSLLVVGQIVVALVMVVAATLCARTLSHLTRAPLGYDRDHVLVAGITAGSVPATERNRLYHRLVEAVATVPGVSHAGGSSSAPFVTHYTGDFVVSAVGTVPPPDAEQISQISEVTAGWLEAYGLHLLDGRTFEGRDDPSTPRVMIVNQAFTRRIWPGRASVGETLTLTGRLAVTGDVPLGNFTIIGVVTDSVFNTIRERTQPAVYLPLAQDQDPLLLASFYIGVRTAAPPASMMRSITQAIAQITPDASLTVRPLAAQVDESLAQDRALAWVSSFFGALALVLAALGLYGVTAHAVTERRREIGLRVALGAAPALVVRLVLARVAMMIAIGVVIGAACSAWAGSLIGSLLFGVNPRDPLIFAVSATVLAASAFAAAAVPAWRASRLDPAEVLRTQ
jgi:putative ABC transport system permease protein